MSTGKTVDETVLRNLPFFRESVEALDDGGDATVAVPRRGEQ